MKNMRRNAPVWVMVFVMAGLAGCKDRTCPDCPRNPYPLPIEPAIVVHNLVQAYERKEIEHYAFLLADDFRFYFDEDTRTRENLPEFFTRFEDSTATGRLFASPELSDMWIRLDHEGAQNVSEPGREGWKLITIPSTFLEVDRLPQAGETEVTTFRVENQVQSFYVRQGRTAADRLSSSETSKWWYVVEWRDRGVGSSSGLLAVERTTWSRIKTMLK